MAVFVSLVVPLSAIAAFRYDMAIPLQTSDREAGSLLWLSGLLILLFAAFLTVILVPLSPRVAQLTQVPELAPYLWLAPVAFMAGGFYHALSYLAVRHRAFRLLAKTRVNQGIGQAVTQIGIGIVSSGPLGLLIGITIRLGSGTITLIRASRDQLQILSPPPKVVDLLATLKRYRRFPLLTGNATFLNLLGQHSPALFLAVLYGAGVAGLFSLALRIMEAPVRLISKATSQVFFSEGSQAHREGSEGLTKLYVQTLRNQSLLALPVVLLVMLPAPFTFPLVFGSAWHEAGLYLQLLSLMFFLQYLAKSVGPETLTLVGRQDVHLALEATKTVCLVGLFTVAAIVTMRPLVAIGVYGGIVSLVDGATLYTAWHFVKRANQ